MGLFHSVSGLTGIWKAAKECVVRVFSLLYTTVLCLVLQVKNFVSKFVIRLCVCVIGSYLTLQK